MDKFKGRYSVKTIAEYVIYYCDKNFNGVSNLRLQKLLYFLQVHFLINEGYALFKEHIVAASFGPIVPIIYKRYAIFGREEIVRGYYSWENDNDFVDISCISSDDKKEINYVLRRAEKISTVELTRLSTNSKPYKDAYNMLPCDAIISKKSIYDHYTNEED